MAELLVEPWWLQVGRPEALQVARALAAWAEAVVEQSLAAWAEAVAVQSPAAWAEVAVVPSLAETPVARPAVVRLEERGAAPSPEARREARREVSLAAPLVVRRLAVPRPEARRVGTLAGVQEVRPEARQLAARRRAARLEVRVVAAALVAPRPAAPQVVLR